MASEILELDPATVEVDPQNARQELRGIPELAASFKELGQLVPVLVVQTDAGQYRLVAGARRRAAAIHAKASLKAILQDDASPVGAAMAALAENDARADLTTIERASAYQTVMDLGAGLADISAATGRTTGEITTVRAVAGSASAVEAVEKHPTLTLDQAAVIAEFDGDEAAVETLVQTATEDPHYWDHEVATLRRVRKDRETMEGKLAILRDEGVLILAYPLETRAATRLSQLTDAKGKPLTARGHMKCPGNAAGPATDYGDPAGVMTFCTDPTAHGHKARNAAMALSPGAPQRNEAQREAASKERREVLGNNKALDTANGVRREYVTRLLTRRTAVKGMLAFAIGEALIRPGLLDQFKTSVWEELTGKKSAPPGRGWMLHSPASAVLEGCKTDNDLHVALFGLIAATRESLVERDSWRRADAGMTAYLTFLTTTGYALTPQEQMIIDLTTEQDKPKATTRKVATAAKKAPAKKAAAALRWAPAKR